MLAPFINCFDLEIHIERGPISSKAQEKTYEVFASLAQRIEDAFLKIDVTTETHIPSFIKPFSPYETERLFGFFQQSVQLRENKFPSEFFAKLHLSYYYFRSLV